MSVKLGEENSGSQAETGGPATGVAAVLAGNQQQAQTSQQPQTTTSAAAPAVSRIMNQTSSLASRMGGRTTVQIGNLNSDVLKEMLERINNAIKTDASSNVKFHALAINRNGANGLFNGTLHCSAIVIVAESLDANKVGLAHHTLLLAGTAPSDPPSRTTQINGLTVEIVRATGDAYDNDFRAVVAEVVRRQFPSVPASKIFNAEAEVLPRGYDYKNDDQLGRTLQNAIVAALTVLDTNSEGFRDFSLGNNAKDLNMTARLLFNQPQSVDSVGLPVRTDVRIEFEEVNQQPSLRPGEIPSLNAGDQTIPSFSLGGFMDLVWAPAPGYQPQNQFLIPQGVQNQAQHLYVPRFVITKVDAPVLNTLPAMLLGLVTVMTLRDNSAWVGAMYRQGGIQGRNDFDPHDIGAIGIEINAEKNPNGYGSPIPTRSDAWTPQQHAQLVAAYVSNKLGISLDVPEVGPETWLLSVFLAAARGSSDAHLAIYNAACLLTNNHFRGLYQETQPIVVNDQNRIHNGYYPDKSGIRRDGRDVDHLCILNMNGTTDPAAAREFSDSFARTDYALELRMDSRLKLTRSVLADFTVTGFSQRITFVGDFLEALTRAVIACGLQIRSVLPYQDQTGAPRAAATWLEQAALSAGNTGTLFNRGFVGGQTGGGYTGQVGFGRWGS